MATVMNSERDPLEIETLPEYVRESRENKARSRDGLEFVSTKPQLPIENPMPHANEPESPQTDVLEALWPGVHHEFGNPVRRVPSFYLTIGFMVGAAVSLIAVWLFTVVPATVSGWFKPNTNVAVTQATTGVNIAQLSTQPLLGEPIKPIEPTYSVQSGDTLAAIALRNYKRVSPRLLDEICRANNMKSADVLVLGQNLILPVYRPQTAGVQTRGYGYNTTAATSSGQ